MKDTGDDALAQMQQGNVFMVIMWNDATYAVDHSENSQVAGKMGFDILETSDGIEAVEIMFNNFNNIDLVLLDLIMPKISGMTVLNILNNRGFFKLIPIVMMSGIDEFGSRGICQRLGAYSHVIKPFNFKHLLDTIDRVIKLKDFYKEDVRIEESYN